MSPKEKKNSKDSSTCSKGCKGRIIGPDQYCDCIESKLPSLNTRKSVKAKLSGAHIERYPNPRKVRSALETQELEKKLYSYGLNKYEVDLLIARFSDSLTIEQIVQKQHWTSQGSVSYHLQTTFNKLRERKYK